MKKLLVPLLLCVATIGTASADWKNIASSDSGEFYIEPSTIRKNGHYKEAWIMMDLKSPLKSKDNGKKYLSAKVKYRFDCASDKLGYLAITEYSGHMGDGKVVSTQSVDEDRWKHISPDSVASEFSRAACGK